MIGVRDYPNTVALLTDGYKNPETDMVGTSIRLEPDTIRSVRIEERRYVTILKQTLIWRIDVIVLCQRSFYSFCPCFVWEHSSYFH